MDFKMIKRIFVLFKMALVLFLLLASANFVLSGEADLKYDVAIKKAELEDKPMLVVVGADWCKYCGILKSTVILPMVHSGELNNVAVAFVNVDEQPDLAKKIIADGQTYPQTVCFYKKDGIWKKSAVGGLLSKSKIFELIEKIVNKR